MDDITIDLEGLEGLAALGELGELFVPRFDVGYAWGGKGRLGVYVDDLSEGLAEYFEVPGGKGALVEDVVDGGAAEKAGIRAGDIIIEIGDESVGDTDELSKAIRAMEGDVPTTIVIIRDGETITVEATVEKADERIVRVPRSGVYIYGDDESKELIREYQVQSKEALEEQMEALQDALEELRKELEELREDTE
jgi:C-terminal processing protease CtpA/Prc